MQNLGENLPLEGVQWDCKGPCMCMHAEHDATSRSAHHIEREVSPGHWYFLSWAKQCFSKKFRSPQIHLYRCKHFEHTQDSDYRQSYAKPNISRNTAATDVKDDTVFSLLYVCHWICCSIIFLANHKKGSNTNRVLTCLNRARLFMSITTQLQQKPMRLWEGHWNLSSFFILPPCLTKRLHKWSADDKLGQHLTREPPTTAPTTQSKPWVRIQRDSETTLYGAVKPSFISTSFAPPRNSTSVISAWHIIILVGRMAAGMLIA